MYERLWVKQHISLYDDKGPFENLVKAFHDDKKDEFVKFPRLEPEQFSFANFATKTKKSLLTSRAEN